MLGDVFDMPIGETLWAAGGIAFGLTLVAAVVALTANSPYRWSGLFLIGYAVGIGLRTQAVSGSQAHHSLLWGSGSIEPLSRLTSWTHRTAQTLAHSLHQVWPTGGAYVPLWAGG